MTTIGGEGRGKRVSHDQADERIVQRHNEDGGGTVTTTSKTYPAFDTMPIAGEWRAGSTGETRSDTDPWSGDVLTEIPQANADDMNRAYAAAVAAQRDWAEEVPAVRAGVMRSAAEVMERRKDEITSCSFARPAARWPRPSWSGRWFAR
jgi:delta 1-pyrroline-5-carboxylate dehydrogenase